MEDFVLYNPWQAQISINNFSFVSNFQTVGTFVNLNGRHSNVKSEFLIGQTWFNFQLTFRTLNICRNVQTPKCKYTHVYIDFSMEVGASMHLSKDSVSTAWEPYVIRYQNLARFQFEKLSGSGRGARALSPLNRGFHSHLP